MVEVRVQTMYRDTEAQTFPWSPPYIQVSKELPEVLLLDNLKWGQGLPAGQHEVEEITRNRKKRAWEIYLASIQKTADIKFKKKIISQIESDDWEFIAQDLENINDERMKLARQVLKEQRIDFSSKLSKKIEVLNKKINDRYEENMKRIQFERDKEIRRINTITKRQFDERHEKKMIIDQFKDKMSDLYAFKVRLGYHRKNTSVVLCEDAFNRVLDSKVKQRKFSPPNRSGKMKKHNCLKEQFVDTQDNEFDEYFRKLEFGSEFDDQLKKPKEHPFDQEEDLILSKTILSEDKSSESETLEEFEGNLHKTEDPAEIERKRQLFLQSFKRKCLEKQERESLKMHVNDVETGLLAKLLDLTSKEQQRLVEEKKILTMALVAQAERWKREAREDGIRQKQKMREAIRIQLLDETFERISYDLEEEFQDILRDSIMDTAILEVEEDMRTKIYNIDREEMPKQDDGCKQEKMVSQLKEHVRSKLDLPTEERAKSLSDLGEINEAVQDMFHDVISVAIDLDNLVTQLAESEEKGPHLKLTKNKLQQLLNQNNDQPALEKIKDQVESIHSEYKLHQEINNDIKKMDKLCNSIIEVADNMYETVLGDADLDLINDQLDNYNDAIVNEELLNYLDKNTTLNIFKLMKLSHIKGENDNTQVINNSYKVLAKANKFCKNISRIALKISCFLFENEYDQASLEDELEDDESMLNEDIIEQEKLKAIRMERLCEKLMKKLTSKGEEKKEIEEVSKPESKIDVCQIKREAAEIIESIVDVWIQTGSLIDNLISKETEPEDKNEIMSKLRCIIQTLEERFGNINDFLGMRELQCIFDPNSCDEETEEILKNLKKATETELESIIDTIITTASNLYDDKHLGLTGLLKIISNIQEPLKTDLTTMFKENSLFVAMPKLLES